MAGTPIFMIRREGSPSVYTLNILCIESYRLPGLVLWGGRILLGWGRNVRFVP